MKVRETEPHSYSSGENFEAANSSGVNPEAANRSGVNPKAANSSGVNHEAANSSDVNHEAVNDTEEGKETGNDFDVNKSGKGKCNVAKSVSTVTKIKSVDNVNSVEFKNACKKTIERYKCPEIKKVHTIRQFNQRSDVNISHCRRCEAKAILNVMQDKGLV